MDDRFRLKAGSRLDPALRGNLATLVASVPVDEGGGSSLLKALLASDLVMEDGLSEVLEVGVWHGRFLLPLSMVLAALDRGRATGIDPYAAAPAVQYDSHDRGGIDLEQWPESIDWSAVYDGVVSTAARFGIAKRMRILRLTSTEAAAEIEPGSIDLLHIDGNHDEARVEEDLSLYLPKVRTGGYVFLDDCSWRSVARSFALLHDAHDLIFRLFDNGQLSVDSDGFNDFAVFRLR